MDLSEFLSALGTGTSLVLNLSPLPTYYRAYKKQETQELSIFSLFLSHLSPLLWMIYSIKDENWELFVPGAINGTLTLYYVI